MHGPELVVSLAIGGHGGFRRGHGVGMEGERLVLPHQPDLAAVPGHHLLQRLLGAAAVRALEVGELDDGDRRVLRTLRRRVPYLDLESLVRGRNGRGGLRLRRSTGGLDVLFHERLVELVLLHAFFQQLVGLAHLLVDHRLERLERHGAGDELAVDEERGRSLGADLLRVGVVLRDQRSDFGRLLVFLPLGEIEPDLLCPLLVLRFRQLGLVREHQRVHLPELLVPLLRGRHRCLRRWHRVRVEAERLVAPDQADVVLVGVEDLLQRRLDPSAVRALEVGPFDDGHLRLLRARPGAVTGVDVARLRLRDGRGRRSGRTALAVLDQVLVQILSPQLRFLVRIVKDLHGLLHQ